MKKTLKKGFTIVELVIVIAVVAILAAVLIPTFVSVVNKANVSNDTALVRNINTVLATEEITDGKPATMHEALTMAERGGFDVSKLTPRSSGDIVWDSTTNRFALVDGDKTVYSDGDKQISKSASVWKMVDTKEAAESAAGYSVYLKDGVNADTITVKTGLDVGNNTINSVNYTNDKKQTVTIRTNSYDTVLSVNAENDVVKHYGEAKEVNIAKVALSSYHEFGYVSGNINFAYGHVQLENGSSVFNVIVKSIEDITPVSDSIKITVESGASANLVLSEVSGVSASVDGTGKDNVAKIDDISGKAVAIGSKAYDTFESAWKELKNNDTLVLLADTNITEHRLSVPANCSVALDLNNHNITADERVFYVKEENSSLEIKGEGKITTTGQAVVCLIGSTTDNGDFYKLVVRKNVEIASKAYGIIIFENDKNASYGVDVTFEGVDNSDWGAIYINGTVNKKTGNVPVIKMNNATCNAGIYLAGFGKLYMTNCTFSLTESLKIKAGEIHMSNNTIIVDCTSVNKQEADYVKNGNGAFGAKCGILFENGCPGYAGLTSVTVTADNNIVFKNNNGVEYSEAMYIDYTETASVDIKIDVRYIGIEQFNYRIEYSGLLDDGKTKCLGYIYFIDETQAKAYTMEKFKEQYGLDEVTIFGKVESIK